MKRYFSARLLFLPVVSLSIAGISACDLTETMQVDADKAMIFGSESGLQAYSYSFYTNLPAPGDACYQENGLCDYVSCNTMNTFFMDGAFTAETNTSWNWGDLHNINYFLDGLKSEECTVDEKTRQNYEGIARWFRAYFYYDKLTRYGEVPWFDREIQNYEFDYMYKDRDSRDVIIGNMIADLDFAYEHIQATSSTGSSTLTKYAAAAFKSRVCLFEASFRRYHGITSDKNTPEYLYNEAADAAGLVMNSGLYSLNTAQGEKGAYRELFYNEDPLTNECILVICCNGDAGVYGKANWLYNSASYGNSNCVARSFVYTFLMKDGSPFTNKADYGLTEFKEEFENRDERLAQIVRGPEYQMDGKNTVADIVSNVAMTGYHIIKFSLDSKSYDNTDKNINSIPVIRYAEVLLNYAEAKAELGELTDRDWARTIGAIRSRAGITGGINELPATLDPYMQTAFYPDVTSPAIMEIRRERAIELFLEGFRLNDLRRWAAGPLIEDLPWTGIHIPALDTPVDINGDGTTDYYFSEKDRSSVPGEYSDILVTVNNQADGLWAVSNPKGGYDLEHQTVNMRRWYEDDRQYLYPIPAKVIRDYAAEGYTLTQNPNW